MKSTTLVEGWRLRRLTPRTELDSAILADAEQPVPDKSWLHIPSMPSMVHDVLLHHGLIETPWLPGRAEACRWVAECDWVYALRFTVQDPVGPHWLRFRGLDTIVDVYLNGERLAQHSNTYLPLRVNVTKSLKRENTLVLHFRTVFDLSGPEAEPMHCVAAPLSSDRGAPGLRPGVD